jgi:hypothetical protein
MSRKYGYLLWFFVWIMAMIIMIIPIIYINYFKGFVIVFPIPLYLAIKSLIIFFRS